jgi:hypothetical protein
MADQPPVPNSIDEAMIRVLRTELSRMSVRSKRGFTKDEAAEYLGCSSGTVDTLVAEGKLHPSHYMRWPIFDVVELDKLLEETKAKPKMQ